MVLNDNELEAKIKRHCGKKINKGEKPCIYCQKKMATIRVIRRQKDYLWKMHDEWKKLNEKKGNR